VKHTDAHIQELLDELGANWLTHGDSWVAVDGSSTACAGVVSDITGITGAFISLPTEAYPNERVAYFVALHEIGHLYQHKGARGWVRKPWPRTRLDQEAEAWSTALRLARYKPTKLVWKHIYESLLTYRNLYRVDRRFKESPQFFALLVEADERSV
jgi:hypothetical protein